MSGERVAPETEKWPGSDLAKTQFVPSLPPFSVLSVSSVVNQNAGC